MNADEWQREVGLDVDDARMDEVRSSLSSETAKEAHRQGAGDTDLMRLCCVQLFNRGLEADILAIWRAKASSMDAGAAIDVQLLCGAGLARTKAYLATVGTADANRALARIVKCEACGDFEGFEVEASKRQYAAYYGVETATRGSGRAFR